MIGRWLVRAQALAPQHALSRLVGWIARIRMRPVKNLLIGAFRRLYRIELDEALEPDPFAYPSFNAFFTRELAPGARPLAGDADTVISPADGTVSECGAIRDGELLQAKGHRYTIDALLGRDASGFEGGAFVTIYLAPHNYHRVHLPVAGELRTHTCIPGRLFSVSEASVGSIDGLFARNERVVFDFDTAIGPLALIMVGALNVGSIESVHAGVVAPVRSRAPTQHRYSPALPMQRGEELARFNLGSTVILLFAAGRVALDAGLAAGRELRLGERLAQPIESR